MQPRITISITCYGRPERTKRSIQCILDQDINNWEAFIMGDCCPDFQKLIDSGYLQSIKEEQEKKETSFTSSMLKKMEEDVDIN